MSASAVAGEAACCCGPVVPPDGEYEPGSCPLMPSQQQPFPWQCAGLAPVLSPQTPSFNVSVLWEPKGPIKVKPAFAGPPNIVNPTLVSAFPGMPGGGLCKSKASIWAPPGVIAPPGTWDYEGNPACAGLGGAAFPPAACNGSPLNVYLGTMPPLIFDQTWEILVFDEESNLVPFFFTNSNWAAWSILWRCRCGTIEGTQFHGMYPQSVILQSNLVAGDPKWGAGSPGYSPWFVDVAPGVSGVIGGLANDGIVTVDPPLGLVMDANGYILGGTVTLEGNTGKITLTAS